VSCRVLCNPTKKRRSNQQSSKTNQQSNQQSSKTNQQSNQQSSKTNQQSSKTNQQSNQQSSESNQQSMGLMNSNSPNPKLEGVPMTPSRGVHFAVGHQKVRNLIKYFASFDLGIIPTLSCHRANQVIDDMQMRIH
jgi:DNA mismatch repair ATPase MutL